MVTVPSWFIQKWVRALNSGQYTQGHGQLLQLDLEGGAPRYCCLGVAATVCGATHEDLKGYGTLLESHTLAPVHDAIIAEWRVPVPTALIHMNDQERRTFTEIATEIGRNLR